MKPRAAGDPGGRVPAGRGHGQPSRVRSSCVVRRTLHAVSFPSVGSALPFGINGLEGVLVGLLR
jgi:hypothetical protein